MRWYDYLACIAIADFMVRPAFDMFTSESIWMVAFNALASYGWWVIFEWYAEKRKNAEMKG